MGRQLVFRDHFSPSRVRLSVAVEPVFTVMRQGDSHLAYGFEAAGLMQTYLRSFDPDAEVQLVTTEPGRASLVFNVCRERYYGNPTLRAMLAHDTIRSVKIPMPFGCGFPWAVA